MNCLCPMTIRNPSKTGKPYIKVPCGKCEACVLNRASQWYTRLLIQQRYSESAVFVTLTYNDDHLPMRVTEDGVIVADVCKQDIRHFHARLRKSLGPSKSKKLKYFLISEYGPNPENGWLHRPHYHGIYFNLQPHDYDTLKKAWNQGFVTFGEINDNRLRYVSGYVTEKLFIPPDVEKLFTFISNGIGNDYIRDYSSFHEGRSDRFFVPLNGRKMVMPRYLKERLYTPALRKEFADKCEARASQAFENDLQRVGGNEERLFELYHDIRANYVRKVRNKHKKKQNG